MRPMRRYLLFLGTVITVSVVYHNVQYMKPSAPPVPRLPRLPHLPTSTDVAPHHVTVQHISSTVNRYIRLPGVAQSLSDIPHVHVSAVNCALLFAGNTRELAAADKFQLSHRKVPVTPANYMQLAGDCERFRSTRRYTMRSVKREELELPIAFSLLMFRDVEQAERLLRAIYRPHNFYCIHVDCQSPAEIHSAMKAIAACLPNVFIASRCVSVKWAEFSVLEPELVCMADLWKYKKWRYFINLTGQEWPLKTNWDLVKILKAYNGGNDIEGSVKRRDVERTNYVYSGYTMGKRKSPNPVDVTLSHGSVHIAAQRGFVDFVLHNPIAQKFLGWINDTWIPDETFFPSLNHSPHLKVPGAYLGEPETHPMTRPFLARFKNWGNWPFDFPCRGKWVKQICILGVGDLQLLARRDELFANKLYLDFQPLALDCLEELHYNKTREQAAGLSQLDTTYYAHLSFAKYHVP